MFANWSCRIYNIASIVVVYMGRKDAMRKIFVSVCLSLLLASNVYAVTGGQDDRVLELRRMRGSFVPETTTHIRKDGVYLRNVSWSGFVTWTLLKRCQEGQRPSQIRYSQADIDRALNRVERHLRSTPYKR